jgi:hypothetical protein
MKTISTISGGYSMSKEEVDRFLDSKLNLQIGTKKVQNLRNRLNVYFSIGDGNFPYKGVKGKGIMAIVEDPRITVLQGEKIYMKYLETLEHPVKMILDSVQKGNLVVIEMINSACSLLKSPS